MQSISGNCLRGSAGSELRLPALTAEVDVAHRPCRNCCALAAPTRSVCHACFSFKQRRGYDRPESVIVACAERREKKLGTIRQWFDDGNAPTMTREDWLRANPPSRRKPEPYWGWVKKDVA